MDKLEILLQAYNDVADNIELRKEECKPALIPHDEMVRHLNTMGCYRQQIEALGYRIEATSTKFIAVKRK